MPLTGSYNDTKKRKSSWPKLRKYVENNGKSKQQPLAMRKKSQSGCAKKIAVPCVCLRLTPEILETTYTQKSNPYRKIKCVYSLSSSFL